MSVINWFKNLFNKKTNEVTNVSTELAPHLAEIMELLIMKNNIEKKGINRLKPKSYKIKKVDDSALRLILNIAVDMTLYANSIKTLSDQKKMQELRSKLDPAYQTIAKMISKIENKPICPNNLHSLKIDLKITAGWLKIQVTHREADNAQTINISIYPWDGNTYAIRLMRMPMATDVNRMEYVISNAALL